MTPQQRADRWLEVWRGLRAHGLVPAERDRVIQREVDLYQEQRFYRAVDVIRRQGEDSRTV
jgi:hypothetical protein